MPRAHKLLLLLAMFALTSVALAHQDPPTPPAAPAKIATPERVRVSAGVSAGLLLKKVNPKYPKKARSQGIQGTVLMTARINKNGDIANLTLVSGDPLLAPAAMEAVQKWKYRPYLLKGNPVEVETQIQVNFTLSN